MLNVVPSVVPVDPNDGSSVLIGAKQNKCAVALAVIALISAAAADWMFSIGDQGFISALYLTAQAVSFVVGAILAVIVQKSDAPLQSERPIEVPTREERIQRTLETMKTADGDTIYHTLTRLGDDEKTGLFDAVFANTQPSDAEKKVMQTLASSESFIPYLNQKGASFARQLIDTLDLNDCSDSLFNSLIAMLAADPHTPVSSLCRFDQKPQRLVKAIQHFPLQFPPQMVQPIFDRMPIANIMVFMDGLADLDLPIAEPLVDAVLSTWFSKDNFDLLSKCHQWPAVVAKHVIDNISVCDPEHIEKIFNAMGLNRGKLIESVSKILPQNSKAIFTSWLSQEIRMPWQIQLLVKSPQQLVEIIYLNLDPHLAYGKMTSAELQAFNDCFYIHLLDFNDDVLEAFIKHEHGRSIFITKMSSLAETPNWLKGRDALAQKYLKFLSQIEEKFHDCGAESVIKTFAAEVPHLFADIPLRWGDKILKLPKQLLILRSDFFKDAMGAFHDLEVIDLSTWIEESMAEPFFTYLQSGRLTDSLSISSLMNLAAIANHFLCEELSKDIYSRIKSKLNDALLPEILKEAIKYPALCDIRYLCLGYIAKNPRIKPSGLDEETSQLIDLVINQEVVVVYPPLVGERHIHVKIALDLETNELLLETKNKANKCFEKLQKLNQFLDATHWSTSYYYSGIWLSLCAQKKEYPTMAASFLNCAIENKVLTPVDKLNRGHFEYFATHDRVMLSSRIEGLLTGA